MSPSPFVLFPLEAGWRVAIVGDAISFEVAESVADVANVVSNHGGSKRVWIALPSHECLCATVSSSGSTNEALKYRLEENLPVGGGGFRSRHLGGGKRRGLRRRHERAGIDRPHQFSVECRHHRRRRLTRSAPRGSRRLR